MVDEWLENAADSDLDLFSTPERTVLNDVFSRSPNGTTHGQHGTASFQHRLEKPKAVVPSPDFFAADPPPSPPSPTSSFYLPNSSAASSPGDMVTPTPKKRQRPGPPRFTALNDDDSLSIASDTVSLLSTSVLPDRIRSFFPFQYFNAMQSEAFEHIYGSDQNIVLSAPTAAGKTTCFDMAIARLIERSTETTSVKVESILSNTQCCRSCTLVQPNRFANRRLGIGIADSPNLE
jgi:hypothetical protein